MTEHDEPLVLINLFSMPPEKVDQFVADWERSTAQFTTAKGFHGTRLHRSLDPESEYPVVNIARWDSLEDWQSTFAQIVAAPHPEHQDTEGSWVSAHPDLYQVVHVTPDPNAGA